MKTAKLIIGIVSIVLSLFVLFQSCAATLGEALEEQDSSDGLLGGAVAVCMLISGIVGICTRSSRGGAVFCTIGYGLAGVMGLGSSGYFGDLKVWGGLCVCFALVFLFSLFGMKKKGDIHHE